MSLHDLDAVLPKDDTRSCIFGFPDRPPDTLPPDPPIDPPPPLCFPYCPGDDWIPPVFPPPPIDPIEPGIYPPGDFLVPHRNQNKRYWGHSNTVSTPILVPPGDPGGWIPCDQPLPPTDNVDNVTYVGASCSKFSGRLATPDGTGHALWVDDHKEAFAEYTVSLFDLRNVNANLQEVKLLGRQLTSEEDGSDSSLEVSVALEAGTVHTFTAVIPPIGGIYRIDNPIFYETSSQSSSVYYYSLEVRDKP